MLSSDDTYDTFSSEVKRLKFEKPDWFIQLNDSVIETLEKIDWRNTSFIDRPFILKLVKMADIDKLATMVASSSGTDEKAKSIIDEIEIFSKKLVTGLQC